MPEPNRRWTDEFTDGERYRVPSKGVVRRVVVEERTSLCSGLAFFAVFVEDETGRRVAPDLGLDEALACVALSMAAGRKAPFLRTPADERAWRAKYMPKPPREIEPWERFLPERATPPERMARQ